MGNKQFEILEEGRLGYSGQNIITGGKNPTCEPAKKYVTFDDGTIYCPSKYTNCSKTTEKISCSIQGGYFGMPITDTDSDVEPVQ